MQRIEEVKSNITSLLGNILKIDSTMKIVKNLAGESSKTAMWATNVGNEYGQVVMSVLTTGEGYGLRLMIHGDIERQRYHPLSSYMWTETAVETTSSEKCLHHGLSCQSIWIFGIS